MKSVSDEVSNVPHTERCKSRRKHYTSRMLSILQDYAPRARKTKEKKNKVRQTFAFIKLVLFFSLLLFPTPTNKIKKGLSLRKKVISCIYIFFKLIMKPPTVKNKFNLKAEHTFPAI